MVVLYIQIESDWIQNVQPDRFVEQLNRCDLRLFIKDVRKSEIHHNLKLSFHYV